MGKKSKGSRKGKKAWRANISTDDIDDYFIKTTKDALSGGPLTSVPDESLFYVDKSTDVPIRKKIEKHREKVLHFESVLKTNAFVKPYPSSSVGKLKIKKKKVLPKVQDSIQVENTLGISIPNIWDENDKDNNVKEKRRSMPVSAHFPAVEIEPLGCSYNPPFEAHQDSLAQAVAVEMQKNYQKELGPQPVPLLVFGQSIDEDEKYFIDADNDEDDDIDIDGEVDVKSNEDSLVGRSLKTKRVTRVELNRRIRRKERMKMEEKEKKMEILSEQFERLPDIIKEIAKDDEKKHKKHARRIIAKEERLKVRPPRLGKYKFEPAPMQVLLSEEISGSLRQLKGCSNVARDRFKSLEKRGLLPPIFSRGRK
ncbi:hypothetical protein ZOSMA_2G01000 [Zostera marina]|uniref:Ribosome biogenesis protein NOP53 n=1 Tax=Zostera marina TaxID=29655 RepID=A0A0K9PAH4_ZOSMR|nr:hypothetical protein ZOSMA_2G01000 [Zostera marina]